MTTHTAVEMVFLDESSKDGRTLIRQYGRAESGETPVEVLPFERGERYSILPALTLDGYIAVRVVPDSVDGAELYDFVLNDLVRLLLLLWFEDVAEYEVAPQNESIRTWQRESAKRSHNG